MTAEYHEPWEKLPEEGRNFHRAIKSLMEELEAVDWYHQRVLMCGDDSLQAILAHNRDEEIEHACMVLEWIRRNMPGWDEKLKTYLFTEGDILNIEKTSNGHSTAKSAQDLGLGSLKEGEKNI